MEATFRRTKKKVRESLDFLKKLNTVIADYLQQIYEYNNTARQKGYYLKPVHIAVRKEGNSVRTKYYYYGRYWYKIERTEKGGIRWTYIGKEKPDPTLPDPPKNPLEGLVVKVRDSEVEAVFASEEMYNEIMKKLEALK
ncbi:hypothetical protein ACSU1N_00935 [Thermogladius sp. 4427co]|uniref:hypothetical protein n=1 Tax=Thermogladius sp. 4427co TaxID=3450718 RepID=UPI003F7976AC